MTQQAKELVAKLDDLTSVPRTSIMQGENPQIIHHPVPIHIQNR